MNAFAERWVRSLRNECFDRMIFIGLDHLRRVLKIYERYYNESRPHQGIDNGIPRQRWLSRKAACAATPMCRANPPTGRRRLRRKESLPGLLASYYWENTLAA